MNIDQLGRRQALAIGVRAEAMPRPSIEHIISSASNRTARRRRAGSIAVGIAVVALVAGWLSSSRSAGPPAAPPGIAVRHVERPDLGFAVDFPASWRDTASLYFLPFGFGSSSAASNDSGYVSGYQVSSGGISLDAAGTILENEIRSRGWIISGRSRTSLNGHPAIAIRSSGTNPRFGNRFVDTTFVFETSSHSYTAVGVGGIPPLPNPKLQKWIIGTITPR